MRKIKYETATGFILAYGNMPNLTAGAGETVVNYTGVPLTTIGHNKVDLGALPTVTVISKTAQEITDFDNDNTSATGADIETRFATKVALADQVTFLKDLAKLQADGKATTSAVLIL